MSDIYMMIIHRIRVGLEWEVELLSNLPNENECDLKSQGAIRVLKDAKSVADAVLKAQRLVRCKVTSR